MNSIPEQPQLDPTRAATLANYLRSQIGLADRPPVGRVELNNEEATRCVEALEFYAWYWNEPYDAENGSA
jgi:hypothetical protein